MQKVGTMADLMAGKPIRATVEGQKILVFLVEQQAVATAARCPHAQGPLHQGEICLLFMILMLPHTDSC